MVTHKLMHRLGDSTNWEERGLLEVSKDSAGKVLQVKVVNNDIATPESQKQDFENACKNGNYYQVSVSDFDIFTSIPAC
jgi:hypothetical protein